ncbi:MAG: hypothetical protein ABUL41_03120 [Chitinophagaceae bacterium]
MKHFYKTAASFISMQKFIKALSLFAFVCFVTNKVSASITIPDSISTSKPWKISHQQFLDQYGSDDTSKAIINYYFRKHDKAQKNLFVNTLITSGAIILYVTEIATSSVSTGITFGSLVVGSALLFGTFALMNVINLIYFSRKKLYKELKNYFGDKKIPSSLKRGIYGKKHFL